MKGDTSSVTTDSEVMPDHTLMVHVPDDFPTGPVSVTITPKTARKRSTAQDLLNSDIVGMWADRTDITDSTEFARELRRKAWSRAKG